MIEKGLCVFAENNGKNAKKEKAESCVCAVGVRGRTQEEVLFSKIRSKM